MLKHTNPKLKLLKYLTHSSNEGNELAQVVLKMRFEHEDLNTIEHEQVTDTVAKMIDDSSNSNCKTVVAMILQTEVCRTHSWLVQVKITVSP